jgi:hypothetical protein
MGWDPPEGRLRRNYFLFIPKSGAAKEEILQLRAHEIGPSIVFRAGQCCAGGR